MSEVLDLLRAGRKPVIGMVQLGPLPGGSRYRGARMEEIMEPALADAECLARFAIDALMVQNLGDLPVATDVSRVQVAWMTRVAGEVRRRCGLPVGLNFLENDAEAMVAVASAAGLDFIRVKVFVGAMVTPSGVEHGQAFAAQRARNGWSADALAIFADVHDRTGVPLALGRQKLEDVPILVGGGAAADNIAEILSVADGSIVSSSLKASSTAFGPVVAEKVERFMRAVDEARRRSAA